MDAILTLNAGSSSIRFAFFSATATPVRSLWGRLERIGQGDAALWIRAADEPARSETWGALDRDQAVTALLAWLEARPEFAALRAVGHRVVHGLEHAEAQLANPALLAELAAIAPYDPEHLPAEIALIEALARRLPGTPQVLCFDTAFHRSLPPVAAVLPIPRRYRERGLKRFGFHGLSYTFLLQELDRLGDPAARAGRVVLAHLGNGASLAAVRDGRSIDTSMGFTPLGGVMMSTRAGDLDPGVLAYLLRSEGLSPLDLERVLSRESGLLGVSARSADMRDLLAAEADDEAAAVAVGMFCYQVRKCIGAYAAALGGIDTLVFAGGIGENSATIRARICEGLEFLGIRLDPGRNASGTGDIGAAAAGVSVRVIATDEELVIAREATRFVAAARAPQASTAGGGDA